MKLHEEVLTISRVRAFVEQSSRMDIYVESPIVFYAEKPKYPYTVPGQKSAVKAGFRTKPILFALV